MILSFDQAVEELADRCALILAAQSLTEQGYSLRQVATGLGRSHEWVRMSLGVNIELTPASLVRYGEDPST